MLQDPSADTPPGQIADNMQAASQLAAQPARGHRRWSDLSPAQQRAIIAAGVVQVALAAAAWTDLARRPAAGVRGPKAAWAAAIAVNFVGPVAYFAWGRRPALQDATPG